MAVTVERRGRMGLEICVLGRASVQHAAFFIGRVPGGPVSVAWLLLLRNFRVSFL